MMKDDLALFESWSSGDVEAGQRLIVRHYDAVYFFFGTKVAEAIAAELTQRTFELMCARADRLSVHTSFVSYLLGIAREVLLERLGHTRPFDPMTDSVPDPWSPGSSPTSVLDDSRRESKLVLALRGLPVDDQILLELQAHEGLELREMAEILEVPYNRIATRLAMAKRRLRRAAQQVARGEDTMTTLNTYLQGLHAQLVGQLDRRDDVEARR